MTFGQLKDKSLPHLYAFKIDRAFPKYKRNFYRKLSAFVSAVSFGLSFDSSPLHFGFADGMFFLFAGACLALFFVEVFYRSMINAEPFDSYALSKILFDTDEIDVSKALVETDIGMQIFLKARVPVENFNDFLYGERSPIVASSLSFGEEETISLADYLGKVYDADQFLRVFLERFSIDKNKFLEAAEDVSKTEQRKLSRERFWSRENLGAIPSIGSLLPKSRPKKINSKFLKIVPSSDLEVEELKDDEVVLSIESILEKGLGANVLIVSENTDKVGQSVSQLAQKIALRVSQPNLEHKTLLELDWKNIEKEKIESEMYKISEEISKLEAMLYTPHFGELLSVVKSAKSSISPLLSSPKIQIIASSSSADYRYYIETSPSLGGYFDKIIL